MKNRISVGHKAQENSKRKIDNFRQGIINKLIEARNTWLNKWMTHLTGFDSAAAALEPTKVQSKLSELRVSLVQMVHKPGLDIISQCDETGKPIALGYFYFDGSRIHQTKPGQGCESLKDIINMDFDKVQLNKPSTILDKQ